MFIPRKPLNNARERFLTADEAARLRTAASASKNTQLRPIVDLLLLTGARVRELLDARWQHVDVERRVWLIPTSKTGRARHVPLTAQPKPAADNDVSGLLARPSAPAQPDVTASFRALRRIRASCQGKASKADTIFVLIIACINEGMSTRRRIVGALRTLGYEEQLVARILDARGASNPAVGSWSLRDDGQYVLRFPSDVREERTLEHEVGRRSVIAPPAHLVC